MPTFFCPDCQFPLTYEEWLIPEGSSCRYWSCHCPECGRYVQIQMTRDEQRQIEKTEVESRASGPRLVLIRPENPF